METEYNNLSTITPEKAQIILAKNGINVNLEDAKKILEMLIFLANLSLDQLLDQE